MLQLILLAVVCIIPQASGVVRESCDVIEINSLYDSNGRLVVVQAIFWEWEEAEGHFRVRAWRVVKQDGQYPQRHAKGGYSVLWQDGELTRQVLSPSIRETWTQYDPELEERQSLPVECRRGLRPK